VPPPPDQVEELLEDLCAFANDNNLPAVAHSAITQPSSTGGLDCPRIAIKEPSSADGRGHGKRDLRRRVACRTVWWSHRFSSVRHADRTRRDHAAAVEHIAVAHAVDGAQRPVCRDIHPPSRLPRRDEPFGPCFAVRLSSSAASSSRPPECREASGKITRRCRARSRGHVRSAQSIIVALNARALRHHPARVLPDKRAWSKRKLCSYTHRGLQGERAGTWDVVSHCEMVTRSGYVHRRWTVSVLLTAVLPEHAAPLCTGFPDRAQLWGRCPPPLTKGCLQAVLLVSVAPVVQAV
jgi:hypothetical protein